MCCTRRSNGKASRNITDKALLCSILLGAVSGLDTYTNPTTDITCGRYDDCLVHCSNKLHVMIFILYLIMIGGTKHNYTATVICDGDACKNIQIFGNRTSSIIVQGYYHSLQVHILFSDMQIVHKLLILIVGIAQLPSFIMHLHKIMYHKLHQVMELYIINVPIVLIIM